MNTTASPLHPGKLGVDMRYMTAGIGALAVVALTGVGVRRRARQQAQARTDALIIEAFTRGRQLGYAEGQARTDTLRLVAG